MSKYNEYETWLPEGHLNTLLMMDGITPEFVRLLLPEYRLRLMWSDSPIVPERLTGEFYRWLLSKWDDYSMTDGNATEIKEVMRLRNNRQA